MTEQTAVEQTESFAFVANVAALPSNTVELAPGHILRRATREEIVVIREQLEYFGRPHFPIWEIALPLQGGRMVSGPETEWRYFVITLGGDSDVLVTLRRVFDIAPVELEIAFTVTGGPAGRYSGLVYQADRLFQLLEERWAPSEDFFVKVSAEDISAFREIYSKLGRHDHGVLNLLHLLGSVGSLKSLPSESPLRFLGYFAILEGVLSHTPQPGDPYQSIGRQIRRKLRLLDNRWVPKLDYAAFGGASHDKIWTMMYAYRSMLAHGDTPNFKSSDLALLKGHVQALRLLKDTVKATLRQALHEPRLLVDLREC